MEKTDKKKCMESKREAGKVVDQVRSVCLKQREVNVKLLVRESIKNLKRLKLQTGWSKLINGVHFTWNDDGMMMFEKVSTSVSITEFS